MTGQKVKQQIDENNAMIESVVTPNIFTLNNTVADLLEKNRKLQKKCPHEFENGFCKFCYIDEDSV